MRRGHEGSRDCAYGCVVRGIPTSPANVRGALRRSKTTLRRGDGRTGSHRAGLVARSNTPLVPKRRVSQRGTEEFDPAGRARPRQGKVRSWEMERRTWRTRARRVARLSRFQCGGRLTLPHPRPLPKGRSRSRPRFCTWGRQPPRPKSGRLAHLAQVEHCKSDIKH